MGVALFAIPFVSFADFQQNLSYGSHGSAVKELQDFLADQGVFTGQSTGSFYSLTQKAVVSFQKANNITPASGYFGNISRGVANQILAEQLSSSNDQAVQETGTTTPVTEPTLKDVVQAQIQALLAQIKSLQAQLQNQLTVQQQTQTTLQQIQQNTTPAVGNVTPAPVAPPVPIVPVDIEVQVQPVFSNGANTFLVDILNNDGSYSSTTLIKMDAPDKNGADMEEVNNHGNTWKYATNVDYRNGVPLNNWHVSFGYLATSTGNKTITFTAGNLTKSINIYAMTEADYIASH